MKKQLIFYLVINSVFTNCNTTDKRLFDARYSKTILVISDVTNKRLTWPDANTTLANFDCDGDPYAAYTFKLMAITDKKINPSFSCTVADGATTELQNRNDEAQFRKKCVLNFYSEVRNSYERFYKMFDTTRTLHHSEVLTTICAALRFLNEDSSQNKLLLIYSDLLERSRTGNAYTILSKLDIPAIAKKLNDADRIPKTLKGITVIVVYNTTNRTDDFRFNKMYSVYKYLLEQRGAIVKEEANNQKNVF